MTPEESLQLIAEEQKALRQKLAQLDASIAVLTAQMTAKAAEPATGPVTTLAPEKPVSAAPTPVHKGGPPPLPKFAGGMPLVPAEDEDEASEGEEPAVKPAPGSKPDPRMDRAFGDAAPPPVQPETPTADRFASAPPAVPVAAKAPAKGDFEMRMGQVWFVRLGIAAILTGLVLGSVYAYKNFIHHTPPVVKVLALYLISGALAGVGLWLEKSRESLRTFGRVVAAGGFAAVYYTTYAMHHVDMLRVIESPLVGGICLLLCALGIFAYADQKKDVTVAGMALAMGYYGTAITPVGWFSLFSNLVLTSGGLWLLWRHRWITMGVLSLVGCYGGFAFWQYAFPLMTTGHLAPVAYWAGQGFLISTWVLFTAVFVFARAEVISMVVRSSLAAANNGAFFALYTIALIARTPMGERQDALAAYVLGWGAFLLLLAWVVQRYHGEVGKPMSETFLAFGLIQVALGLAIKLSGYQLATVFAFKAALLAWFSNKQNRIVPRIGSVLLAGLVLLISMAGLDTRLQALDATHVLTVSWQQYVAACLQALLLFVGGWYLRKPEITPAGRSISLLSLGFCIVAAFVFSFTVVMPVLAWTRLLILIFLAAALLVAGSRKVLAYAELSVVGIISSMGALLIVMLHAFGYRDVLYSNWLFDNTTVSITALLLLGLAWLCKRQSWMRLDFKVMDEPFSLEAFLLCGGSLLSWVLVVLVGLDEWWESPTLLIICGVLFLAGRSRTLRLPELSIAARIGALVAAAAIVWTSYHNTRLGEGRWDLLGALLNTLLLGLAAWLAKHRWVIEEPQVQKGEVSFVAFYYSVAAVASFIFVEFLPLHESWQPAFWVLFCAALIFLSKLAKADLPELGLCAGVAAVAMTVVEVTDRHMGREMELWLLLAFFAHAAASLMPTSGWKDQPQLLKVLRWAAGIQLLVSYVLWWNMHEKEWFPLATAALAVVLAGAARKWQSDIAATFSLIMLGLGLATFVSGVFGGPYPMNAWSWLVPLLVMGVEWLVRGSQVYDETQRKLICHVCSIAGVATLWVYLTKHVLADGSYRTMAWAGLALVVFVLGFLLKHTTYRRCGLALLALAIGRVVFYDVWQLDTAARFATFLVLGGVLVALGFFYNRFEDFIRKYL